MKKNIHRYERVARVAGGALLSSLAFIGPKKPWFLSFLIPVATGLVGTCPLYSALNISTRKKEEDLANDYFPVQSSSERAAGHPLVGSV
jgi:hypothetical protein